MNESPSQSEEGALVQISLSLVTSLSAYKQLTTVVLLKLNIAFGRNLTGQFYPWAFFYHEDLMSILVAVYQLTTRLL